MCTILLRWQPGRRLPVLLLAVRDEFADRSWQPPAGHWVTPPGSTALPPGTAVHGGRDTVSGGTWLAVDRTASAVAAVVNGPPQAPSSPARSRGSLPLTALAQGEPPGPAWLSGMAAGFHLLRADTEQAVLWSWDAGALTRQELPPGDHVLTFSGLDAPAHPRTAPGLELLASVPDPDPRPGVAVDLAWGPWTALASARPAGLPGSLLVSHEFGGRAYASTSASLVALSPGSVRYDFTADPADPAAWYEVPDA